MTASFQLVLDTHAPRLTWGAYTGTTAGELFQIAYQLDEPGVLSATITLADGRTLTLSDTGSAFEVMLPPDTANGPATVRATTRDDVWNQATYSEVVQLTGTVVIPEQPPPAPGYPGARRPRRRPQPATVTSRSRARATSAASVIASSPAVSSRLKSTASGRVAAVSQSRDTVATASSSVAIAAAPATSRASSRALTSASVRRGDDPELAALVALGLL